MSNEPTKQELEQADFLVTYCINKSHFDLVTQPLAVAQKEIAEILAAHRRDDELAQALEELAAQWNKAFTLGDGYLIYRQCASELRAALAARKE